jgi:WD40 repeat protein
MKYFLLIACSLWVTLSVFGQDLIKTIPNAHSDKINALAISADGETVFSAGNDEKIMVWHSSGSQKLGEQNDQILDLEIRGNELFSAGREQDIFVWDVQNLKQKGRLRGHEYHLEDLGISLKNNWLVSASRDNSVKIWNNKNNLTHSINGHPADVKAVAISPDGKFIASVDALKTLRIWRIDGKELIKKMKGRSQVKHIAFSNDGKFLVAATGKNITVWKTENWTIKTRLRGHHAKITYLKFHPDGQHLATSSEDKKVIFWNIETGKVQFSFVPHKDQNITALAISKDGKTFATASQDKEIKIWEIQLLIQDLAKKYSE